MVAKIGLIVKCRIAIAERIQPANMWFITSVATVDASNIDGHLNIMPHIERVPASRGLVLDLNFPINSVSYVEIISFYQPLSVRPQKYVVLVPNWDYYWPV